jgi:CDP-diacylglycerol--glycerol-3-phosphate 3-phosphatidyltransferase
VTLAAATRAVEGEPWQALERRCQRAAALGAVALLAAAAAVGARGEGLRAAAFLATALGAWTFVVGTLWRGRGDNVRHGRLQGELGAATSVTLVRGWLISAVAGFLVLPAAGPLAWAPGFLYSFAAVGDGIDGALARRTGTSSRLGATLDVSTDALGLLAAPAVGVCWGRLPPWYLLLAAAYPLFQGGVRLRMALGRPTFPQRLRGDPRARFFAGVQMGVVASALYPVLPLALTWTAATLAMLPTLLLFAGEWRTVTRAA